jgi:molecular chaperone GrpE
VTDKNTQGTPEPTEGSGDAPFQFTDKRKVDPATGAPREAAAPSGEQAGSQAGEAAQDPAESEAFEAVGDGVDPLEALDFQPEGEAAENAEVLRARAEAAEHLDALQRERAAFTNYRNRTLREQESARRQGTQDVLTALLPVLDDIERAKQHAELSGPMAAIAEKIDQTLARFGVARFGAVGEEFDPTVHEALMHSTDAEAKATTVNLVVEPGYRIGEKVVRAARVGVVGPE